DPDVWDITKDYDRPLQAVARNASDDALTIAKALIEAGADIDYQGDYDCTALARSVENKVHEQNDWAMARYLISAKANPSLYDKDGLGPAEYASSNGNNSAIFCNAGRGNGPERARRQRPADLVLRVGCARCDSTPSRARGRSQLGGNTPHFPDQTPLQRAVGSLSAGAIREDTFRKIAIQLIGAGADPAQIAPAPKCLAGFLHAREERAALSGLPPGIVDPKPHRTL
ncbi:MAG: hypothetical protein IPJ18_20265, partial [Betaproteobacteria bacterium]|nr:hypothetical protein [Betaproteobacteria bacterium]